QDRISDADSLARGLLDPNHVLAEDFICHGGTYGPSGGALHVCSSNGARLGQLRNETPKQRQTVQLWTTTGVGTWRLAHCPGDRHGRLGAIRTLSALIFACESRIPAGN